MKRSLYTRPDKPMKARASRKVAIPDVQNAEPLPTPLMVDRSTECHVTPADVAERMVDYLQPEPTDSILEPSAGTGELIKALSNWGIDLGDIVAVELHCALTNVLPAETGATYNSCFLTWAQGRAGHAAYDKIIMNPPFRQVRQHVKAALSLLADGGRLVALVPVTFEHERAEPCEYLPVGTFPTAPGVRTKIIEIEN